MIINLLNKIFILRQINCHSLDIKRFISNYEANYKLFKYSFELHHYKATTYIQRHKLDKIDPVILQKVVKFCEEHGFTKNEMLKNPPIFRTHPITLDQHYTVMAEGGFTEITLQTLSKFRTFCRRDVHTLKEIGLIPQQTNVVDSFIQHLDPRPEGFYVETGDDSVSWNGVHERILIEYLSWRLDVTKEDILKLLKTHEQIQRKSFRYLCENIKRAEELGFPKEKMLKYGYILQAYPKGTQGLLEKFPKLAGVDIKKAIRQYPKLMTAAPDSVQRIYNALKEHNIPEEAISRRLNVFCLSPDTVEFRLQELKRISDFKVLIHNPNILKLVVHQNRAKSRLAFLKNLQLKCSSVMVLGTNDGRFDTYIKEGKDINSFTDTYSFLEATFKKNAHEFDVLKKHPYYLLVPLTTMQETYSFLKGKKFTTSAIFGVIYILLYPKEKVQNAVAQAKQYEKETNSALTQINILNLALYFIEREHHFTGDGVWVKSEIEENLHS